MSDMELMARAKKNCTAVMSWKRKAQTYTFRNLLLHIEYSVVFARVFAGFLLRAAAAVRRGRVKAKSVDGGENG